MKNTVFIILICAINLALLFVLRPSFWTSLFVVVPLLVVFLTIVTDHINSAAIQRPLAIPDQGVETRIERLRVKARDLASLGFRPADRFYLKLVPDCVVGAFRHSSLPVWCLEYDFGSKQSFELITSFRGGYSLNTLPRHEGSHGKRPAGELVQVFEGADAGYCLDEHLSAVRFLCRFGALPDSAAESGFRDWFFSGVRRSLQYKDGVLLYSVRLIYWLYSRRGRIHQYPLEEQARLSPGLKGLRRANAESIRRVLGRIAASARFDVVFRGEIAEGARAEDVKRRLAALFRCGPDRVENLFAGRAVVLRKKVDGLSARKYREALRRAGALCRLEPLEKPSLGRLERPAGSAPVKLVKRVEKEEKVGLFAYALALLSFIPMWGVLPGIASVVFGVVKRKIGGWKVALIGAAGIAVTAATMGGMLWSLFGGSDPKIDGMRREMAQGALNRLVEQIELYRVQNGSYPDSLEALRAAEKAEDFVWIYDTLNPGENPEKMRTFHYALEASGARYTLRSAGMDGKDGTEDDVYPSLEPEKSRNYGFLAPGRSP